MGNKNVIFIMIDQLRWDCLSCYGHPIVETPNIDKLANKGVRFTRTYTQGTSCGNSRASFYSGRHVRSHGATWNNWPLRVDEWNITDHIGTTGAKIILMGKTHMKPDLVGMQRLGIEVESELAKSIVNAGFVHGEHDDGLHPSGESGRYNSREPRYNTWLREQGFRGENPWQEWANSGLDSNGTMQSGFFMRNAHLPCRLPAEFSESAYLTDRAIEAIEASANSSFFLHLSYIKPHWPYMAPAPYHDLYRDAELPDPIRHDSECDTAHPVLQGFMKTDVANCFADNHKRRHVLPTYLGLIKQLDDEIGRLVQHLEDRGLSDSTMIALTSDHGDFLGDHWLGEKDLMFDSVARIPLIVFDPSPEANATRGSVNASLTGAIDLLPTFVETLGGNPAWQHLEGESLIDILHGAKTDTKRDIIVSEGDYGLMPFTQTLGRNLFDARMAMAFDGRYKLFHFPGFPDLLFDLQEDPSELINLANGAGHKIVINQLKSQLLDWSASLKNRTTVSPDDFQQQQTPASEKGIYIGYWNPPPGQHGP